MNISNIKYILEIEKCGSITLASKRLFVAQPNLSKIVKEVESEYDITIFSRSPKGVKVTPEGQKFIQKLEEIQEKIDGLESDFLDFNKNRISAKIACPRASYVSYAFTRFIEKLDTNKTISIHFQETSTMTTINNLADFQYDLGIIRFEKQYEQPYFSLLDSKHIDYQLLMDFNFVLLCSKDSPLAEMKVITGEVLRDMIQIMHGDIKLPGGSHAGNMEDENAFNIMGRKRIYVYERGSQFDLLHEIKSSYMWVSPMPESTLTQYGLVQRECNSLTTHMCDYLIFNKHHDRSKEVEQFINELHRVTKEISQS